MRCRVSGNLYFEMRTSSRGITPMNNGLKVGILGLAVLAMGSAASAAPLGLAKTYPDIYSNYVGIYYSANTDQLNAVGGLERLYTASNTYTTPTDGYFNLSANIDSSGNASSGSIQFFARQAGPASSYVTLLSGTLAPGKFGFSSTGGNTFEFIFNVTGGTAAAQFGPKIGMLLIANFESTSNGADFSGSFTTDFGNSVASNQYSIGTADTFAVPEPAAIAILSLAGLGFLARKR